VDQNQWFTSGSGILVLFSKILDLVPIPVLKEPGPQFQFGSGSTLRNSKPWFQLGFY
jgi:hypothetical protein